MNAVRRYPQKLIGDYQVYAAYANELEAAKRQWNAAG